MSNTKDKSGISLLILLTIIFIALKLNNNIDWSWIWVFSPILLPFVSALLVFVLAMILYMTVAIIDSIVRFWRLKRKMAKTYAVVKGNLYKAIELDELPDSIPFHVWKDIGRLAGRSYERDKKTVFVFLSNNPDPLIQKAESILAGAMWKVRA